MQCSDLVSKLKFLYKETWKLPARCSKTTITQTCEPPLNQLLVNMHFPLFCLGDKYWVFKEVTAEPGYPHSLVELGSCLPREGIDTALRWEPVGKTYFFKGDRYWRYNEDKRATDPGYPKPITVWKGIPQAPQGAFVSKEGCEYEPCYVSFPTELYLISPWWFFYF